MNSTKRVKKMLIFPGLDVKKKIFNTYFGSYRWEMKIVSDRSSKTLSGRLLAETVEKIKTNIKKKNNEIF